MGRWEVVRSTALPLVPCGDADRWWWGRRAPTTGSGAGGWTTCPLEACRWSIHHPQTPPTRAPDPDHDHAVNRDKPAYRASPGHQNRDKPAYRGFHVPPAA